MKILEEVKEFGRKHKGKIILGVTGLAALVAYAVISKEKDEEEPLVLPEPRPFADERQLDMVFQTKEGEILGKVGCYESFMDDMMDEEDSEDYRVNKEGE